MDTKNEFHRFLAKCMLMLVAWLAFFYIGGEPAGGLDDKMTEFTVSATKVALSALNIPTSSKWFTPPPTSEEHRPMQLLIVNGIESVSVGNRCNGLFTMAIYAAFIIAYPGKWKSKMVFVPMGIAIIFLSNVARVGALALNWIYYKSSFEMNHKYTYTFIVYAIVCCLWMWWINKYSFLMAQHSASDNNKI